jgi:hypothetical protein
MHFWTPEGRPAQSGIVPTTNDKALGESSQVLFFQQKNLEIPTTTK